MASKSEKNEVVPCSRKLDGQTDKQMDRHTDRQIYRLAELSKFIPLLLFHRLRYCSYVKI
jgi:hypothetical protein